jgi:hypothetical protein
MFSKFTDDSTTNFVFTHFRNLGIIGVVVSAALWKKARISDGWLGYLDYVEFLLILIIGAYLVLLNLGNVINHIKVGKFAKIYYRSCILPSISWHTKLRF